MIKLNDAQKKVANFKNGVASCIAIPGSGKTITMTHRIANLIKNHGVAPESILGLTFTRNAAQAMREKLRQVLKDMATRVNLSTIHSFCYSLLKSEGRAFEIMTDEEQLNTIKKIIKRHKIKGMSAGTVVREIRLAKNNLTSVEEFKMLFADDETMERICHIYELYEKEKKKKLKLDMNDLLTETYDLLSTDIKVREKYQFIYSHILIDEFQDTNPAQMEIVKLLAQNRNNQRTSLFVVGDDWQSIYSFTGASVGNILNFRKSFPESEQFILDLNYRSTKKILEACQRLIHNNKRKIEKVLKTDNPEGDEVITIEGATEEDEAMQIVEEIKDLVDKKGYALKDIAVLYRANAQSRVIEEALRKNKIPYHIENGMNFYQRFEVKVLLEYLRLINNPYSDCGDEALKTIINVPNRYIGRKFMEELEEYAAENNLYLYEALKAIRIDVPYINRFVREFIAIMEPLIRDISSIEPAEMIGILREVLDYDKFITDDEIPSPDDEKIANINQLMLSAVRYGSIESLLSYTDTFTDEKSHDKNGVALMTIHKSKGLEFPVVFIIGMIDGIIPDKRGDIEEERRIAFVAATRAMKMLYLTHSRIYMGKKVRRSTFLDEMIKG
ncbi:MAG TPA: ATP-dependent helicase [Syntrophorhabdaceae bacterium]|nr:ATP-dependent helicase [Syntrophorhabdaceae bacterium]